MTDTLSIVILTYDRPDALLKTIAFLQSDGERLPIIVADGSGRDAATRNAAICAAAGSNVAYLHLPSDTEGPGATTAAAYAKVLEHYFARCRAALDRVTTDHVVVCGDDDFLVPSAALAAAAFLDANPDYVACHGRYVGFRHSASGIRIDSVVQESRSIDGAEVGSRLIQLLAHYEAPYYAVYRASAKRAIVAEMSKIHVGLFFELYHSSASVLIGKIKRMDGLYYLRNVGDPPQKRPLEGWYHWAAADLDGLFERYREHRARILALLSDRRDVALGEDRLRRAIDMSFLLLVGRQFHLDYWIDEYLTTAVASGDERVRLRGWLDAEFHGRGKSPEGPPGRPAGVASVGKAVLRRVIGERGVSLLRRLLTGRTPASSAGGSAAALAPFFPPLEVEPALRGRFAAAEWSALARRFARVAAAVPPQRGTESGAGAPSLEASSH